MVRFALAWQRFISLFHSQKWGKQTKKPALKGRLSKPQRITLYSLQGRNDC